MNDALVLQIRRDPAISVRVREVAKDDLNRVREATERIKRMTRVYQERLDGTLRRD